jgi:hypothetical protein
MSGGICASAAQRCSPAAMTRSPRRAISEARASAVRPLVLRHVADCENGFRRSLGRDHKPPVVPPHVPHHFKRVREGVFRDQFPREQMIPADADTFAVGKHGLFHRIVGVGLAAQPHKLGDESRIVALRPHLLHAHSGFP